MPEYIINDIEISSDNFDEENSNNKILVNKIK